MLAFIVFHLLGPFVLACFASVSFSLFLLQGASLRILPPLMTHRSRPLEEFFLFARTLLVAGSDKRRLYSQANTVRAGTPEAVLFGLRDLLCTRSETIQAPEAGFVWDKKLLSTRSGTALTRFGQGIIVCTIRDHSARELIFTKQGSIRQNFYTCNLQA